MTIIKHRDSITLAYRPLVCALLEAGVVLVPPQPRAWTLRIEYLDFSKEK